MMSYAMLSILYGAAQAQPAQVVATCRQTLHTFGYNTLNEKRKELQQKLLVKAILSYKEDCKALPDGWRNLHKKWACKATNKATDVASSAVPALVPDMNGAFQAAAGQRTPLSKQVVCQASRNAPHQPCLDLHGAAVCEQLGLYFRGDDSTCTKDAARRLTHTLVTDAKDVIDKTKKFVYESQLWQNVLAKIDALKPPPAARFTCDTKSMTKSKNMYAGWNRKPKCMEGQSVAAGFEDAKYDATTDVWTLQGRVVAEKDLCVVVPLVEQLQQASQTMSGALDAVLYALGKVGQSNTDLYRKISKVNKVLKKMHNLDPAGTVKKIKGAAKQFKRAVQKARAGDMSGSLKEWKKLLATFHSKAAPTGTR